MRIRRLSVMGIFCGIIASAAQAAFVHPGCLSTQADLDRMAAKVAANEQPWQGSWDILVGNNWFNYNQGPEAVVTVCVDSGSCSNNYMNLARDCARAYQCALRYHGSGDTAYADKAVQIMNTWAFTHTGWSGNTNVSLRAGLYGYQFACAGELMRDYSGWNPSDFVAFQQYMIDQFYGINNYFLTEKHGTVDRHYWANWCHANVASMMAIGVLCDDQAIFDDAVDYVLSGPGNESMANAVPFVHPNGLGQWQESGRDQGHTVMGPQLMGAICEIAWNQGVDLYGYLGNRFLASVEYISRYNLWYDVPWAAYAYESGHPGSSSIWYQASISGSARGSVRPGWDLVYNHYVNRLGMSAPWTRKYAENVRPEGGGMNYGSNSGGFDGLGFTTLTHSRDPIATGAVPSHLASKVQGRQIILSWAGSAYAKSYNVKHSTISGGPYSTLAIVDGEHLHYLDPGLTAGTTYYYVISANNPGGEGGNSDELAVTADGQLHRSIIGMDGSYSGSGATKEWVFDGYLDNYFDPPSSGGWVGLDLGFGVSAVIKGVRYCPRTWYGNRMVGGEFQASNDAVNWTTLYTITTGPPNLVLTEQSITSSTPYRYVRYINNVNWANVGELQFLGDISGLIAPAAPAIKAANLINGYTAELDWTVSSGATHYYLKRAATSGGPYTIIALGDVTGFNDGGLDADTTYYYVVSALNSAGQSADSDEVSVTTQSTGPSLTAYYKMEGNVNDSSGNGYHASTADTPIYTAGQISEAIVLDGADDYVTLPVGVTDTEDITVAAWINWNGGDPWQRVWDFGSGETYYMFLTPRSGDNTLRFAITNTSYTNEQRLETTQMPTGQWVHVAVTLAGTTGTLYVNGLPVNTNTGITLDPSGLKTTLNYFGKSQFSSDALFSGHIDDFRIYNYALSGTAITQLAQTQATMDDLSILTVWWLWLTSDCGSNDDCLTTDINGDGIINLADFAALARKWL